MRLERRVIPPARPALVSSPPLRGWWLLIARTAWVAMASFLLVLFVVGLPASFTYLQTICVSVARDPCPSPPPGIQALHYLGLSTTFYAAYYTALDVFGAVVSLAVAAIIVWRKSSERIALFCAFTLLTFGLVLLPRVTTTLGEVYPVWQPILACLGLFSLALFTLFFYLFPDGRFVPRWTWGLAILLLAVFMPGLFWPYSVASTSTWPPVFLTIVLVAWLGSLLGVQVYRYRYVSDALQRQQTKWVVFGVTGAVLGLLLLNALLLVIFPSFSATIEREALASLVINAGARICMLFIPLSIGVAILRYRLWEIDLLINRSLLYGLLTTIVVGLYLLVVVSLGALFQAQGNVLISLLATGLIAVIFQPLRIRLQRIVNRLMYGERDEPYQVIARLGERMEATLAPDAILPIIVETVAQALKLPYAAVTLQQHNEYVIAASYGMAKSDFPHFTRLPLIYQGEPVGELVLAPRAPGESFTAADQRLLQALAHQIGIAVHAVQLTADRRRMADDLQRSRERLVLAREEERRRLRRDLHDDLGPTLAALALTASNVGDLIPTDPDAAVALTNSLQNDIRATVGDIRRLVYELRPSALDELGLLAAIRERAVQLSSSHQKSDGSGTAQRLLVHIEAPEKLPSLPAAVEVATYRIVQEALTNVTRHAYARTCTVRLALSDALEVEILDDGIGLPTEHQAGVGLLSIRERAAELGGSSTIEKLHSAGTRVYARLPVSKE